jgi:hypothetical protein
MKYLKKGNIAKSENNELLLVNESDKAYKVDEAVIAVWNMCDGTRTKEEIVEKLSKEAHVEKEKINEAVSDILAKLEEADLLQKE